jgi:hypothetical protein
MHARLAAELLAGAAVLAAGPGGVPAHAATAATWTVSPGGAATATATAGTITLTDTRTGAAANNARQRRGKAAAPGLPRGPRRVIQRVITSSSVSSA